MKPLSLPVLLILQLTAVAVYGLPRRCNRVIRPFESARSTYGSTKTTVIAPICPVNGLIWKRPLFQHVVVFHKDSAPFRLCLTLHNPGITVHRLRGTSRQLVAGPNTLGSLGCFESHCKHLTLMVKPGGEIKRKRIKFTYTYNKIRKHPRCTEVCQKSCFLNSQYIFIGVLKQALHDLQGGLYRFYFKIARFIKYDGSYTVTGRYRSHICSNHSNVDLISSADAYSLVPTSGLLRVYSKHPLQGRGEHLVAGSLHSVGGKSWLMVCCVDENATYAASILRDAWFRQSCEC